MDDELYKYIKPTLDFREHLTPESDRGCALIAAAYIDTRLESLLRECFVDDQQRVDSLLEQSKALGSFSARIDIAYAIGAIGKDIYRDLHLIRKIRNAFGHDPKPIQFDESGIAARCRELTTSFHDKSARPRSRFTNTVMGVLAIIDIAILQSSRAKKPDDLVLDRDGMKKRYEASLTVVMARVQSLDPQPATPEELDEVIRRMLVEEQYTQRRQADASQKRAEPQTGETPPA